MNIWLAKLMSGCALALGLAALPAHAHLDGIMPLAADDVAAVAQLKTTPAKHVLVYFGDHAN